MQGARITVHLELDREELLALLSYIALGLNFSAAYSGEGGFLSRHEIGLHLSYINADGAARLTAKLATQSLHSKKRGSTRTRVEKPQPDLRFDWRKKGIAVVPRLMHLTQSPLEPISIVEG
jgi:hypothetical protein